MKIKNGDGKEVELQEYIKDELVYHAYGGEGLGSLENIEYTQEKLTTAFSRLLEHLMKNNQITEEEIKEIVSRY